MSPGSGRVRVGVDVGGTFTKAVAIDLATRQLVATSIVATTHSAAGGVAEGVVTAVAEVAEAVGAATIDLVTHSTTQAVNALLEGDVGVVGVIGMGRRPDLKKVEKLTQLRNVEVAPGKSLGVRQAFFDVTDGLPVADIRAELVAMKASGVVAVAIAEAFSPDDSRNEDEVAAVRALAHAPDPHVRSLGDSACEHELVVLERKRVHHTSIGTEQPQNGVFPGQGGPWQTKRMTGHSITERGNMRTS